MEGFKILKIIFTIFAILSGYFLYDFLSFSGRLEDFKRSSLRLRAKVLRKEIIQKRGVIYKVIYEYEVNNKRYQGDNWVKLELFEKLEMGDEVEILVSNKDFENSRLESEDAFDKRYLISLTLLIIFGFITVSLLVTLIISKK